MIKEQGTRNNKNEFATTNPVQMRKLGELLAEELRGGEIICLTGELGSGKTTFAQGVLKGLGAKGPFTSPTFLVIKHYKKEFPISNFQFPNKSKIPNFKIKNIYHIDAYRVNSSDVLELGWEEIVASENNVIIIEWAERIRAIIPDRAVWIKFEHMGNDKRKISVQ